MNRSWIGPGAAAAVVAGLACAPSALAAPPTISGADGDAWSTTPVYVVTGGAGGVEWDWTIGLRSGDAESSPFEVRATGLRDGNYTLRVVQRNGRGVVPRQESAQRRFTVDTRAPRALEVLGPTAIVAGEPLTVTWAGGEADAVFTWSVVIPGAPSDEDDDDEDERPPDVLVQGPVDTPATSATITGLAPGSYEVLVTQRDRAGNVSPVSRLPVAVSAPTGAPTPPPAAAGAVLPSATPPTALPRRVLTLPARNAGRLRPRKAATIRVVRPILRWTKGPLGTSLYNVQVFRVGSAPATSATAPAVTLRKVNSVFPRTTRVRSRTLARGACYVWRVWPYRAGRYTRRPLGVSHFCVSRVPPRTTVRR